MTPDPPDAARRRPAGSPGRVEAPRIPRRRGSTDVPGVRTPRDARDAERREVHEPDLRAAPRRIRLPVAVAALGMAVVTAVAAADAPAAGARPVPDRDGTAIAMGDPVPYGPAGRTGPTGTAAAPGPTVVPGTAPVQPLRLEPVALATALPDERARIAVQTAMAQIGLPYVWGGDGPGAGESGFDCSGLTHFAYSRAGISLPRTAHTQFRAGPRVPAGAPLQVGDLVFYGTYQHVHHVGMYIGNGRMINAPTFGKPVQTAWYRWAGDDYVGASRPAASDGSSAVLPDVPEVPDLNAPRSRPDFVAPAAPRPSVVPQPRDPQPSERDSANASRAGAGADIASGRVPPPPSPLVGPLGVPGPSGDPGPSGVGTGPVGVPGPSGAGTGPAGVPGPSGAANGPAGTPGPSGTAGTPGPSGVVTGPNGPPGPSGTAGGPTATPTPTPEGSADTPVPRPAAPGAGTPTPNPTSDRVPPPPSTSDGPTGTPTPTPTTGSAVATLLVGSRSVPVPLATAGPDGLPPGPGVVHRGDRWIVVLPASVAAGPGTPVTLRLPDGRTVRWTVVTRSAPGPRVAPPGTPVVLLVPAGGGRWTVLTAR